MQGNDRQEYIPLEKPNAARIYDYLLGGFHSFAADRQIAAQLLNIYPDLRLSAQVNRAFLGRSTRFLIQQGIEQFIDIGSGLPTIGNVHEIAQQANPAARVVYIDSDSVAVRHSNAILQDNPHAIAIQADARQPDQVLSLIDVCGLIDFHKPMAILLVALLHFIVDDAEATTTVSTLRDALPSHSYLVISHSTHEHIPPHIQTQIAQLYTQTVTSAKGRSRTEIEAFFEGFNLVEPGVVFTPQWHPENARDILLDEPARSIGYVGVGQKP